MKVRLTEDEVAKLKYANGKEYRVADEIETGFYVRVTSDARTFVAQASVNGKTKGPKSIGRYEDGMPVAEARRLAALQIAAWRTGANVQMPAPGVATLRAAFDEHLAQPGVKGNRKIRRSKRTEQSYRDMIERHTPADWFSKPLSFLNREMVNQRHTYIGDNHGQTSADLWLRYIHAIYEGFDKRHPELNLPKNPASGVDKYGRGPRKSGITWETMPGYWKMIESLSPIRRDCWKLVVLSGLRNESACGLRWKEINWQSRTVTIPAGRMKSQEDFTLPLSRYLVDLLRQRKADNAKDFGGDDCGYVFPTTARKDDEDGRWKAGDTKPIENLSEQGYDGDGNKIRVLPGTHAFRKVFNSVAAEANIPEHHRFYLVSQAMPKRNVNEKHYLENLSGLEPYRESLEVVTARILKGVDVDYNPPGKPKPANDESKLQALAEMIEKIGAERFEALAAALLPDSQRKTG